MWQRKPSGESLSLVNSSRCDSSVIIIILKFMNNRVRPCPGSCCFKHRLRPNHLWSKKKNKRGSDCWQRFYPGLFCSWMSCRNKIMKPELVKPPTYYLMSHSVILNFEGYRCCVSAWKPLTWLHVATSVQNRYYERQYGIISTPAGLHFHGRHSY